MTRAPCRAAPSAVLGLTFLLAGVPGEASGQAATGTVRGTVVESGTRRPLAAVQVFIKGTAIGRVTSESGVYVLPNVPAGAAVVRIESIGYRSFEPVIRLRS